MSKTFTKLTRPAMRKLSAGDKLNEHGITFVRQANSDGVFSVNVKVDGQRIHRVIGRESDGTTRTQAPQAQPRLLLPALQAILQRTSRCCSCRPPQRCWRSSSP